MVTLIVQFCHKNIMLCDCAVPGAVVDVDTMPLLRFSLKVKWTPPAGEDKEFPVTLYHVSLYTVVQDSEALETKFANSTMNEAVFFDLKDNTTYRFRVAAENAVGKGPYSEYVLGNTFPNGNKKSQTMSYIIILLNDKSCYRYSGCGLCYFYSRGVFQLISYRMDCRRCRGLQF